MEGPGGNQPRRRAGDSNSPQNPSPIKDWQRNTWYGPAPQDTNPFEEPDEAPELLELRSDNVRQKSGEFWQEQNQQTGYISSASSRQARVNKQKNKKKNSGKLSHMLGKALLFSLVLVLIALGVLYFGVYRVRDIQVVGNELISANDIISISGIKKGDSMLALDETKIAESMMTGTLEVFLISLQTSYPSMPGSMRSRSTRSGWKLSNFSSASSPSSAIHVSKHSFIR